MGAELGGDLTIAAVDSLIMAEMADTSYVDMPLFQELLAKSREEEDIDDFLVESDLTNNEDVMLDALAFEAAIHSIQETDGAVMAIVHEDFAATLQKCKETRAIRRPPGMSKLGPLRGVSTKKMSAVAAMSPRKQFTYNKDKEGVSMKSDLDSVQP